MNSKCATAARLTALAAALLLWAGCASQPGTYAVLLSSPGGGVGRVAVSDPGGTRILERSMQATTLDRRAPLGFDVGTEQLTRDFGAALAAQPPLPETLVIHFERGGARMTVESARALAAFADRVRERPAPELMVVGHTDTVGADAFNWQLGLERARQVAAILREHGVVPLTLSIVSEGEHALAVETADGVDEARNRRAVVTVR